VIAMTFGVHSINVAVLAGLAALGAFFDPAGITARETMLPEAAKQAGWTWTAPTASTRRRSTSPTSSAPASVAC
jgi:hypothetical protein